MKAICHLWKRICLTNNKKRGLVVLLQYIEKVRKIVPR